MRTVQFPPDTRLDIARQERYPAPAGRARTQSIIVGLYGRDQLSLMRAARAVRNGIDTACSHWGVRRVPGTVRELRRDRTWAELYAGQPQHGLVDPAYNDEPTSRHDEPYEVVVEFEIAAL